MKPLPLKFYLRPTKTVAQELLGKKLVRQLPHGQRLSGIIVETEAYLGVKDKACHTFGGRKTLRTSPMFLLGGHAYIYFTYGMHFCFNVVTERKNVPEAVLIRALEPLEGIEQMEKYRKTKDLKNLCSGPAKICQALALGRDLNAHPLNQLPLWIEEDDSCRIKNFKISKCPRVGIAYAEEAIAWPLRFYVKDSPFVSKMKS